MAYRLLNCCDQPLRLDLRGGDTLLLPAGALSPVLREELLYENVFVAQWLAQGLVRRLAASLGAAEASTDHVTERADEHPDSHDGMAPIADQAAPTPEADNDEEGSQ